MSVNLEHGHVLAKQRQEPRVDVLPLTLTALVKSLTPAPVGLLSRSSRRTTLLWLKS